MAMARRGKKIQNPDNGTEPAAKMPRRRTDPAGANGTPAAYWKACNLTREGKYDEARLAYARLQRSAAKKNTRLSALIQNDLAAIAAMQGQLGDACHSWRAVLDRDATCEPARLNLALVEAELVTAKVSDSTSEPRTASSGPTEDFEADRNTQSLFPPSALSPPSCPRIAVLSFLFNWPSTGGGNMHTAGLVDFLGRAGYEVRHFYASYPAWGIGRVTRGELPGSHAIEFSETDWNVPEIQRRFRAAVDAYGPDDVVISDTWNMKPHLAEAMRGYPTILLMQAQECLCPLNNLRLIGIGPAHVEQCPRNQLATPQICHQCLAERGQHTGALHQVERALAGVGTPEYDQLLRQSLVDAEAVLVLNPITAAMLEPFARCVRIVPWGIDPARFPWPPLDYGHDAGSNPPAGARTTLFMAAVAGETIKGFHVAHEACRILRETRSDFELVVTFDPPGQIDEITRSVGWCSQAALPWHYYAADIVLVATIAQDALSITSVEAMAAGKPVIASRIGGLPYTVTDGLTGLLFNPGNPFDLAEKIARLLDEPELPRAMGLAGRRRFEQDFMWPDVIERYWRPLLGDPARRHMNA
jgi:glycosyltransferase involved in cell wall biosynthesis